jgi:hypothetical protein
MFLAQALFPLLKDQASSCYIVVDGMLGEFCSMPNAAALSIANAAIFGIVRALEAEHREAPQRVVEVSRPRLIKAIFLRQSQPMPLCPSPPCPAPPDLQLRIAALIRKSSKPGHPFITTGTAYDARLIGDKAVQVATGQQRAEIVRIRPADLEAALAAAPR